MKLVKPSYEILTTFDSEGILKRIEAAGRTCYKSEEKITGESAIKFIGSILKRGHESVIEHESISVRFICDRGVTHEMVRHRLAAYSQECVVGSTEIKTGSDVKPIYELYQNYKGLIDNGKTPIKTMQVKSVDEENVIINNKIKAVFYKGTQPVYKVITASGYEITCTMKHRFLNTFGDYVRLENLQVGDEIMVNGRPSLLKISNVKLEKLYIKENLSPTEIAERYNCPYRTVLDRLHKLGIFDSHRNDKNKEKYNKNHTKESYEKMSNTIQDQYDSGREVWNKGVLEDEHPSVKQQANNLRENHHNNGLEEDNSNWKGEDISISGGYQRAQRYYNIANEICEMCCLHKAEHRHHIDENPTNNVEENILFVCINCHKKIHEGWHVGTIVHPDEIENIEYEGRKKVYDLEMEQPYHNYIADGFVTHNSTRYCNYSGGVSFILPPWITNIVPGEYHSYEYTKNIPIDESLWFKHLMDSEQTYINLLQLKWTPQQARAVLPNSLKTEIVMTANIREWRHVLTLRTSKAAHPQIREVMIPLLTELKEKIPILFEDIESCR